MPNNSKLNKLMGSSSHIEMIVRRLYRNQYLSKYLKKAKKQKKKSAPIPIDFSIILKHLRDLGVKEGDTMVVHSAYSPLKGTGLTPEGIVDGLKSIVGETGTLVMPVIRKYPESPSDDEALTASIENLNFTYDVEKSKVWTGIIPKILMNKPESKTSRFPLNTVTALGPEAGAIIKDNLKGNLPTPNGKNSSWKYLTDINAWVISIGTDLTHSLTMIHTAEDTKKDDWPVKGWYRKKKFTIIDGDFREEKIVLERHPRWGMLHFGERKLCSDLIDKKVMTSHEVEGVIIESMKSQELYAFLNAKNKNGYPYFWVSKYL